MEKSDLLESYFIAYMNTIVSSTLFTENFNLMSFIETSCDIPATEIDEVRDLCHSICISKVMGAMLKLASSKV
jgi:hypothetical protein